MNEPVQVGIKTLQNGRLQYQVVWRWCEDFKNRTYESFNYDNYSSAINKKEQMIRNKEYK